MDISIPEYVEKAIDQLHRTNPKRPQYAPHRWTVPAYVKRLHMAPDPDEINILDKKITNRIQFIVGTFLYYARSVDPTLLRAINEISRVQSKLTRDTKEKSIMLLDYEATYPNAFIHYNWVDS